MEDKEYNALLIKKYPFLQLRNVWTDELNSDISSTYLDWLPEGWKKAFGELICEDINNVLIKEKLQDKYRIMEVKEKFGGLRWYDNFHTEELQDIISKYEHISRYVCVKCGKINVPTFEINGWISPYCDECAKKILQHCFDKDINNEDVENCKIDRKGIINVIHITSYSNHKETVKEIDCSDIINRMLEKS